MGELRVVPDIGGQIPKIDDAPWPGFPADLNSIMTVIATQVKASPSSTRKCSNRRSFLWTS
jgi:UDP-N-acetylglucosamine 1-carboxyvinyltransferase